MNPNNQEANSKKKIRKKYKKKQKREYRKNVHHEIILKGHWMVPQLPFRPKSYFVCNEYNSQNVMMKKEENGDNSKKCAGANEKRQLPYLPTEDSTTIVVKLENGKGKTRREMRMVMFDFQDSFRNQNEVDKDPKVEVFPYLSQMWKKHLGEGHNIVQQYQIQFENKERKNVKIEEDG